MVICFTFVLAWNTREKSNIKSLKGDFKRAKTKQCFCWNFFLIPLLYKYLQFNNTTKPNSSLNFHISEGLFTQTRTHQLSPMYKGLRTFFHNMLSTRSLIIPKLSLTECPFTNQALYVFAANISGCLDIVNWKYYCPLASKCEIDRSLFLIFKLNLTF